MESEITIGSHSRKSYIRKIAGLAALQLLIAIIATNLLLDWSLAGTEAGEFCPTCPDWSNLDSWYSQKQAYDQKNMDAALGTSNAPKTMSSSRTSTSTSQTNAGQPEKSQAYPEQRYLTYPGSGLTGSVIIDVMAPSDYEKGHLSGARNLYWKGLQSKGKLDAIEAEGILRAAGINNTDSLLIYGGDDDGAAYVFWALSYLGHRDLSILDGGVYAAEKAGASMTQDVPSIPESDYVVSPIPALKVDDKKIGDWVYREDVQIIDARSFSDYGISRLTSESIPLDSGKFYDDSKIKDPKTLDDIFSRRGLSKNMVQMVYGTPKACSLFYALKVMGYNATVLDGSGWSKSNWAVRNVK
jgi:thiosulfate/3-mercaptopyruvate sulfurtransferase